MQMGMEEPIKFESQGGRSGWSVLTHAQHKETFHMCACTVSAIWLEKGI